MGKVVYYMSMSLDGFVTAADISPEEPLGSGGERLHEWASDPQGGALLERVVKGTGAVIVGRTTYDASLLWWGPDGPTGPARLPVFVVTHRGSPSPPAGGVYTLVTDGIDSAVRQAKAAIPTPNATHLRYRVRNFVGPGPTKRVQEPRQDLSPRS